MPPGTGDAQLSLSQMINLDGVVMVTTPQEVSLSDVRRAVNMFSKVNVEVLGVVENMSGFTTPDGQTFDVFGSGGGEQLCAKYGLTLLGKIPLEISIREGGDSGKPAAVDENCKSQKKFYEIADKLIEILDNKSLPEIKVVN